MSRTGCRLLPVVVVLLAALAGCQGPPRVVMAELPSDPIVVTRPRMPGPPPTAVVHVERDAEPDADADVPATWVPSVHERPWRWIVVHHSATDVGSADIFDRAHRARGWDELGYHFVITNGHGGADGQVQVGSRWVKQKWGAHCGGTPNNEYNNFGIGVCVVGDCTSELPSPAQLAALTRLVIFLADRYRISPACLIGHRDAPNASTACPGEALQRYIHHDLRPLLRHRRQLAAR